MKVIIAGSRSISDYKLIQLAIMGSGFKVDEIISGGARGVDSLGEKYALDNGITVSRFNAQWDVYGKSAGYRRNGEMAIYGDCLIAIWDGQSKGTKHMINMMRNMGKPVYIEEVKV